MKKKNIRGIYSKLFVVYTHYDQDGLRKMIRPREIVEYEVRKKEIMKRIDSLSQ